MPSFSSDEMVERLQRAWDVEPGYSKTAIVNAVTRAANTEEWRSWSTSEDLERAAGELLYAKVWNVQMPDGPQLQAPPPPGRRGSGVRAALLSPSHPSSRSSLLRF